MGYTQVWVLQKTNPPPTIPLRSNGSSSSRISGRIYLQHFQRKGESRMEANPEKGKGLGMKEGKISDLSKDVKGLFGSF